MVLRWVIAGPALAIAGFEQWYVARMHADLAPGPRLVVLVSEVVAAVLLGVIGRRLVAPLAAVAYGAVHGYLALADPEVAAIDVAFAAWFVAVLAAFARGETR